MTTSTHDIQHVQRITASGRLTGPVHAEWLPGETFCMWAFVTRATHNGNTISLAADVTEPVSCKKCVTKMRMEIQHRMGGLSPESIESLLRLVLDD